MSRATFTPHVGTVFRLSAESSMLDLVLTEAAEPKETEPRAKDLRKPFSLTFRGPPQPVLPQHTYRLTHDSLGDLDIFLVPIGADEEGVTYEAIFA